MGKRSLARFVVAAFVAWLAAVAGAQAQAPKSIKIGYAVSLTGPNAAGVNIITLSNYRLWVKEVNEAGGIMLRSVGRRVPIEVIEYDDRNSVDEAVAAVERLINKDKVDFLLAPWGTGLNLAVGPLFNSAGYPHLVGAATTDQLPELVKRWPNSFWFLGTATAVSQAVADTVTRLRTEGKVGGHVAMVSVADQFGIGLAKAARAVLKRGGFDLVYDRPYPVGLQDMSPIIDEVKQLNPNVFIAFSYPPDTVAITDSARTLGFNPQVFYTAIGTSSPLYLKRFGADAEGVLGMGGWNPDAPGSKAYFDRYVAMTGQAPDRWGGPIAYASLQMLQQAIERVGKIDRAAVIKELQTGTFETIMGPIKLKDNRYMETWYVGQWQDGQFYGVEPAALRGARPVKFPKPPWRGGR